MLPNSYTEVPLQVKQACQLGFTGAILATDGWGFQDLRTACGSDCDGSYFTTHYSPTISTPTAQAFIQAYQAACNKTPDDVAARTYDSFGLLFQAIRSGGSFDRQSIRTGLAGISSHSVSTSKR